MVESPLENLLASLCGCEAVTLRFHAKQLNYNVENIKFIALESRCILMQ